VPLPDCPDQGSLPDGPKPVLNDLTDRNWPLARNAILLHVETRRRQLGPRGRILFDFTGGRVGMSYFLALAAQLFGRPGDELVYTNTTGDGKYLMAKDESNCFIPRARSHYFFVTYPIARLPFLQSMAAWTMDDREASAEQAVAHLAESFEENLDTLQDYTFLGLWAAGLAHSACNLSDRLATLLDGPEPAAGVDAGVPARRDSLPETRALVRRLQARLTAFDTLRTGIERGAGAIALTPVPLAALVQDELAWLERESSHGSPTPLPAFELSIAPELVVPCPEPVLRQLVELLLQNAVAAALRGGQPPRVSLAARAEGARLELRIANSGEPFPDWLLPYALKAAKPMWLVRRMRQARASEQQLGSGPERRRGIGLAVAARLAEQLWRAFDPRWEESRRRRDERLRIEPAGELGGATYRLSLPLVVEGGP
jgi:hypothetical protein